jgi:hypothetical protein
LLVEVGLVELVGDVEEDGVGALVRERAVEVGRARLRGARDDEEVARALAIEPRLFDGLHRRLVELVRPVVEHDHRAAVLQRGEERVEVVVADRREGLHVGGLAAAARVLPPGRRRGSPARAPA